MAGFNTQPRRGGCNSCDDFAPRSWSFNTQPRRGGCVVRRLDVLCYGSFNTQPRRGGCVGDNMYIPTITAVSTHSRAEAAAI